MAQEFGAGHEDDLRRTIADSCVLAGMLSVILLALGQIFVQPLMVLLRTPSDIMGGALLYLRVIFIKKQNKPRRFPFCHVPGI